MVADSGHNRESPIHHSSLIIHHSPSPRRILHVIPTLDRSGAERQLTLLARGLPRDEFDVHVCALTRGGPLLADLEGAGVPVTRDRQAGKLDPRPIAG